MDTHLHTESIHCKEAHQSERYMDWLSACPLQEGLWPLQPQLLPGQLSPGYPLVPGIHRKGKFLLSVILQDEALHGLM